MGCNFDVVKHLLARPDVEAAPYNNYGHEDVVERLLTVLGANADAALRMALGFDHRLIVNFLLTLPDIEYIQY